MLDICLLWAHLMTNMWAYVGCYCENHYKVHNMSKWKSRRLSKHLSYSPLLKAGSFKKFDSCWGNPGSKSLKTVYISFTLQQLVFNKNMMCDYTLLFYDMILNYSNQI